MVHMAFWSTIYGESDCARCPWWTYMLLTGSQCMRQCPSFEYEADDHANRVWWSLYWCSAWLVGNYSSSHNCAQLPSLFCSLQFPSITLDLWNVRTSSWFSPQLQLHCNSPVRWPSKARTCLLPPHKSHLGQSWAHLFFLSVFLDLLSWENLMRWGLGVYPSETCCLLYIQFSLFRFGEKVALLPVAGKREKDGSQSTPCK